MAYLITKNSKTNKAEKIIQYDLHLLGDGNFTFQTSTELEAYKAAYLYKNSNKVVTVEYARNTQMWLVSIRGEAL